MSAKGQEIRESPQKCNKYKHIKYFWTLMFLMIDRKSPFQNSEETSDFSG